MDWNVASWWPWVAGVAAVVVTAIAAGHVVLNKRDVRAAIGWTGLIVLSPFFGAAAYYLFGINRIRRRAARLAEERPERKRASPDASTAPDRQALVADFDPHLRRLSRMVRHTIGSPLVAGNAVTPLIDGDEAYPAMMQAIRDAERSILLTTYIFDADEDELCFVEVLADAVARGVEVRVLIDGVGARYSRPRARRALRRRGVPAALFLPPRVPLTHSYMNLRNHRKILVVDRRVAFAGGMNIRRSCLLADPVSSPVQDFHFRIEGPVVDQLFAIAAEDWVFATGEGLGGDAWASATASAGSMVARAIADGPDEDFENLRWTLMAAVASAQQSLRIATPYFLPEAPMLAALRLAALRGLEVDILLPAVNNLRIVEWAAMAQLWQVLEPGCRVWLVPPPFDHSKVLVVDRAWSLIGSANWDPRSLRLNFELGVECYDHALADTLADHLDGKREGARLLSLTEVDGRSIPVRLRDGVARLFAPYL